MSNVRVGHIQFGERKINRRHIPTFNKIDSFFMPMDRWMGCGGLLRQRLLFPLQQYWIFFLQIVALYMFLPIQLTLLFNIRIRIQLIGQYFRC